MSVFPNIVFGYFPNKSIRIDEISFLLMNLILVSQAENDLESIRDPEKVRRIAKKIDNIENKIKQGVGPEKIIEK